MDMHELVIEMKLLERRPTFYEEKYSVFSEDFCAALALKDNFNKGKFAINF